MLSPQIKHLYRWAFAYRAFPYYLKQQCQIIDLYSTTPVDVNFTHIAVRHLMTAGKVQLTAGKTAPLIYMGVVHVFDFSTSFCSQEDGIIYMLSPQIKHLYRWAFAYRAFPYYLKQQCQIIDLYSTTPVDVNFTHIAVRHLMTAGKVQLTAGKTASWPYMGVVHRCDFSSSFLLTASMKSCFPCRDLTLMTQDYEWSPFCEVASFR